MIVAFFMIAGSNREEFNLDSLESARPESLDSLKDCAQNPHEDGKGGGGPEGMDKAGRGNLPWSRSTSDVEGLWTPFGTTAKTAPANKADQAQFYSQGFRDHGNCHQVVTQALQC